MLLHADAAGSDNGAHPVEDYCRSVICGFGPKLPGPFGLLRRRRLSPIPALFSGRCQTYSSRSSPIRIRARSLAAYSEGCQTAAGESERSSSKRPCEVVVRRPHPPSMPCHDNSAPSLSKSKRRSS